MRAKPGGNKPRIGNAPTVLGCERSDCFGHDVRHVAVVLWIAPIISDHTPNRIAVLPPIIGGQSVFADKDIDALLSRKLLVPRVIPFFGPHIGVAFNVQANETKGMQRVPLAMDNRVSPRDRSVLADNRNAIELALSTIQFPQDRASHVRFSCAGVERGVAAPHVDA
jgi:hypothetical protein